MISNKSDEQDFSFSPLPFISLSYFHFRLALGGFLLVRHLLLRSRSARSRSRRSISACRITPVLKTHSAFHKRIQKIGKTFEQWADEDLGFEKENAVVVL